MKPVARRAILPPEGLHECCRIAVKTLEHTAAQRKIAQVDTLEAAIGRMTGNTGKVTRPGHCQMQRAKSTGRLAEQGPMRGLGQRPKCRVDGRHQLIDQIAGIVANGQAVDVLVTTKARVAVRKHGNHRRHAPGRDQTVDALGNVFTVIAPGYLTGAGVGIGRQAPHNGVTALVLIIAGRQVNRVATCDRIAQRVACQPTGLMGKQGHPATAARGIGRSGGLEADASTTCQRQ